MSDHVRLRVGSELYAIPIENVLEVAELGELSAVPGAEPVVLGVRNLHGQVLPVFDLAWALVIKCSLCALLGENDVLLQAAAKMVEISERHGYRARQGNGLSWRGLARSRLGELDAGIDDARVGHDAIACNGACLETRNLHGATLSSMVDT